MDDPGGPVRTLYVGNLDPGVTEELLYLLFSQFGTCTDCKIIREIGHDPYAFVKYTEHQHTQAALMAMNKRNVLGKELKVNWATHPGSIQKQDTTNHFHIYVGDLSPDIDSFQIKNAFSPFGEISDCKVIRDPHTQMSKGYAFVCFVRKEDAENAISTMNGQWLGGRTIRTNWASGKGNNILSYKPPGGMQYTDHYKSRPLLDYDEVYNQSSSTNMTIYCGGIQNGLTEDLMRETFGSYGNIVDIRIFKDKCYAFVKMDGKEAACNGIVGVHGTEVNGYPVRCSWGKEMSELAAAAALKSGVVSSNNNNVPMAPPVAIPPVGYWGYQQAFPQIGNPTFMGGLGQQPGLNQPGVQAQQQVNQNHQLSPQQVAQMYGYGNFGGGIGGGVQAQQQQMQGWGHMGMGMGDGYSNK